MLDVRFELNAAGEYNGECDIKKALRVDPVWSDIRCICAEATCDKQTEQSMEESQRLFGN